MTFMKRIFAVSTLAIAGLTSATSQVPNGGFESWAGGSPTGWFVSPGNVTQSADAHSGSSAVQGTVVQLAPGVLLEPVIQSGSNAEGFAYSQRPTQVTGWYKFSPVQGDRFGINVILYKGGVHGTPVANAALADSTTRTSYSQFVVPFNYLTADVPDTCVMQFLIAAPAGGGTNAWHLGSTFTLDDLSLGGATSVAENSLSPTMFELEQNYPNPFNPSTTIEYTVGGVRRQESGVSNVKLSIYDVLGREVAVLVDERQAPGSYTVSFNASALASGVYFYRLSAGNVVDTRQMILMK